jgi:hypothetical protein
MIIMAKFHINKNGVPSVCRAHTKPCPLGGDEVHFSSKESAQAYLEKENQRKHGLLGTPVRSEAELDAIYTLALGSEKRLQQAMENAYEWATSREAEEFVKLGKIGNELFRDSDLLRETVWDLRETLDNLTHQQPTLEEIEQFEHVKGEIPKDTFFNDECELVSLSMNERQALEDLGYLEDATDKNIIVIYALDGYSTYNTMTKQLENIDGYSFLVAKTGSYNGIRKKLLEELKDFPNVVGLEKFKESEVLNSLYKTRFLKLPKSYHHVLGLRVNDPDGLLNEDLSIDIKPGKYRAVSGDGVIDTNVYAKPGSAGYEFSQQYGKNEPLIRSEFMMADVMNIGGERVYDLRNHRDMDTPVGTILMPESVYQKLVNEGEIEDYGQSPLIKVNKPTAVSLDPDIGASVWRKKHKETQGDHGYGFHFKDNDAYEENTGWLSKEYNALMNEQESPGNP